MLNKSLYTSILFVLGCSSGFTQVNPYAKPYTATSTTQLVSQPASSSEVMPTQIKYTDQFSFNRCDQKVYVNGYWRSYGRKRVWVDGYYRNRPGCGPSVD